MKNETVDAYWNKELDTMPADTLRNWQFGRIKEHLAYVYANSPYYRRSFDVARATPDRIDSLETFSALVPTITKAQIIENHHERPPFGDLIAVDPKTLHRVFWSPGPETVFFNRADWDYVVDLAAHAFFSNGCRPGEIVNVTATYHFVIAGLLLDAGFQRVGAVVIPGGVGMSQMQIEVMRMIGVTTLFAFPTFAEELGKVAREMGLDPARDLQIRRAHIAGEIRSEAMRKGLEDTFGMVTREFYGTTEVPYVAYECPAGGGMHLQPRFFVEVIDPATGAAVAPGESGEVVVTDFQLQAKPMIRYRTGDLTAGLKMEPCSCGRTTPRLQRILGRTGDIPRVKGMFVVPRQVEEVVSRHAELGRFRLIIERPQHQDTLTVQIERRQQFDANELRPVIQRELKERIRLMCDVEFVDEGCMPAEAKMIEDRRKV